MDTPALPTRQSCYLNLFNFRLMKAKVVTIVGQRSDLHMLSVITNAYNGDTGLLYQLNQLLMRERERERKRERERERMALIL